MTTAENRRNTICVPGHGVETIQKLDIKPIKTLLRDGQFDLDQETLHALQAFTTQTVPTHCVQGTWESDSAKGFRNAYTSCVVEQMWNPYLASIGGSQEGSLYQLSFNAEGRSVLTETTLGQANSAERAIRLGAFHEMTMDHFILEQFANGNVPQISSNQDKDKEYLEQFKLMTDVGRKYGIFRVGVPENTSSAGAFIIRGVRAIRAQLFGLPNLITQKANEAKVRLDPSQHRLTYERSLRTAVSPYYLPTFPLLDKLNSSITRGKSADILNPDSFSAQGNQDDFIVFVNPEIVSQFNNEFAAMTDPIQKQTACPVYSARVIDTNLKTDTFSPFPRSLSDTVLRQLDIHYYPVYAKELAEGQLAEPIFEAKNS